MAAAELSLKDEVESLILEQIHAFKQASTMSEPDIFEYHLRHYRIMTLFSQLDRLTTWEQ